MKHAFTLSVAAIALVACGNDSPSGEVTITEVDEATAASALEALYLAESGQGAVSWDSRTFEDGVYTFTGLTFVLYEGDQDTPEIAVETEATEPPQQGPKSRQDQTVTLDAAVSVTADTMTLAGPRFDADGNVIFDRLAISTIGIGVNDDDTDGSIGQVVIEQPNAAMVMAVAESFSGEEGNDGDSPQDWTYGLLTVEGLSLTGTEDGNTFTVGFDRFAIEDLGNYAVGLFELTNFAINGEDDEVGIIELSLDEVSASNIGEAMTYPFVAQMALAGAAFSADVPNEDITADIPEVPEDFDPLNSFESAAIRGLDANIGGVVITLDELTASTRNDGGNLVSESAMTPLIIAPDTNYTLGAQMALGLGLMGYQQLEFVSAGASVYEREADRGYTTGENYFEMRDGFRVEVESDVSGILAYSMQALQMGYQAEPDPSQVMAMLEPLVLNSFVFRLEDLSLLDRALTAASATQGVPKETLRQQAGGMIALATLGAPAEIPRPLLAEFSPAMTSFIANGGSVEVRIAPETPLSVGDLVAQAEAGTIDYEAAGITISAIPPDTTDD
ncbi:hypothetical protein [Hyphobacterium sp.]|uniref:hypothetical protein n=1 Tax=Hyphobacterium sp. TaxID=2004662 RepID=UPI003BA91FD3